MLRSMTAADIAVMTLEYKVDGLDMTDSILKQSTSDHLHETLIRHGLYVLHLGGGEGPRGLWESQEALRGPRHPVPYSIRGGASQSYF